MFTDGEIEYMASQRLGRLATAKPDGTLQNSPVGFGYNAARQCIDIGGHNMAQSRKYRNIADNGKVAFVIDDIASLSPWVVRCLEIRGHGEVVEAPTDSASPTPGPIIRIHPTRIISWGVDPAETSLGKRDVTSGS